MAYGRLTVCDWGHRATGAFQEGTKVEVLKFEESSSRPARRKKSGSKWLLPVSLVVALGMFGSTFAANISINSGSSLEFGQGVLTAAACDSDITLTPTASFDNDASSPIFRFGGFSISGVGSDCNGKTLTVRAYNNSDDTALQIGTSSSSTAISSVVLAWSATPSLSSFSGTGLSLSTSTATSATVAITTPSQTAGNVYKMTIESSGS